MKKTATISEFIKKLEEMKEELGDVKVFVIANDQDDALPGTQMQFWGLSDTMVAGMEASSDDKWVMCFRSDEILQP